MLFFLQTFSTSKQSPKDSLPLKLKSQVQTEKKRLFFLNKSSITIESIPPLTANKNLLVSKSILLSLKKLINILFKLFVFIIQK